MITRILNLKIKWQVCFTLALCTVASIGMAQQSRVRDAVKAYQNKELEKARLLIDSASEHEETAGIGSTWYYRGFIYKDIYNQQEKSNPVSPARIEAVNAFQKYLEIDSNGELKDGTIKSLKYLATTLYNDAATGLTPKRYEQAISNYGYYKEIIYSVAPNTDLSGRDIQFNLVLGSVYTQIYDSDREKNKDFFEKIRDAYYGVLELDSVNLSANYNLGILYYNEAVNIIKSLDYETDLITLELIQEECVELFKKSLPYMQKAYDLNPKRKETLIGLAGIYFSLNEMEKSEEVQNQLLELEKTE